MEQVKLINYKQHDIAAIVNAAKFSDAMDVTFAIGTGEISVYFRHEDEEIERLNALEFARLLGIAGVELEFN